MATNSKRTETLVGVFLFIGFGLLGGIILLFGNIGDLFKGHYELRVNFKEAAGIIEGSTVRLRGAKIGEVGGKPQLTDGSMIQVVLKIEEQFQVAEGSVFQIGQASLLGDKEVIITPPAEGVAVPLPSGSVVMGSEPGGLDLLQSEAELIVVDARDFLRDAKGSLAKLEGSMDEIRRVVTKVGTTMDAVNEGILTEGNLGAFGSTLANLERASASFADLGERLDPLVGEVHLVVGEVRETNQVIQGTIKAAEGTLAKIDPALEEVPAVLSSIGKTADRATEAIDKIDGKKGALGALVSDQELKTDVKDFVRNLKRNGVLRYKDEDEAEDDPRERFRGRRR